MLCEHNRTELVRYPDIEDRIVAWFERRGREVLQVNRDQALLPACLRGAGQSAGTASGMWFDRAGGVTVSMPGVPYEMEHILTHGVIPGMRNRLAKAGRMPVGRTRSILTMGTGESQLAARIDDLETRWLEDGIKLAYLPKPGQRAHPFDGGGRGSSGLDAARANLVKRLSEWVVSEEGNPVDQELARPMTLAGWTLAVAESCTGGGLGAALVAAREPVRISSVAFRPMPIRPRWPCSGSQRKIWRRTVPCPSRWPGPWPRGRGTASGRISGSASPEFCRAGRGRGEAGGHGVHRLRRPGGTRCVRHRFGRDRPRNLGMTVRAACATCPRGMPGFADGDGNLLEKGLRIRTEKRTFALPKNSGIDTNHGKHSP